MTSEYFMDKLEEWELLEFYDVIQYAEYIWWDTARFLFSSQLNMKKVGKLSDIITFPWDENYIEKDEHDKEISNDDVARLKKKQEEYLKKYNQQNGSTEEN